MPSSCDGGVVVSVAPTIVVLGVFVVLVGLIVVGLAEVVVFVVALFVTVVEVIVVGVAEVVVDCPYAIPPSSTALPQANVPTMAVNRISGATAPLHRSGGCRRCRQVPEMPGDRELEEDVLELRAIADVVHDHVPVASRRS